MTRHPWEGSCTVTFGWSTTPVPVPYADLSDPQTLNQYSYVRNNPISKADADGHETQFQLDPQAVQEAGQDFDKAVHFIGKALQHPAVQAFVMVFTFGAGASAEEGAAAGAVSKTEQLATNKAAGKAFEKTVVDATKGTDANVAEQVTLKTESGVKTRMDVVSQDASGQIKLTEAKASATAPLTPNQAAAHPEIERTGATVVGQGKPPYTGGTTIPPTKVDVVRPNPE